MKGANTTLVAAAASCAPSDWTWVEDTMTPRSFARS
ncbi:hypothetical protein FHS96_003931 [Sphingomonas zeicaulis]